MEDRVGAVGDAETENPNSTPEAQMKSQVAGEVHGAVAATATVMGPPSCNPKLGADRPTVTGIKEMGPPPARPKPLVHERLSGVDSLNSSEAAEPKQRAMAPPSRARPQADSNSETQGNSGDGPDKLELNNATGERILGGEKAPEETRRDMGIPAIPPYVKPTWSAPPEHPFSFEVLREGSIVATLDVSVKAAYMFGRSDACDFVLEHPTSSRFHAVLQYKPAGGVFIYDNGSTHGTFVNKSQIDPKVYVPLRVGDVVRFGHSSRLYIFQGPQELMPEEASTKSKQAAVRARELALERKEQAESLQRARAAAIAAEGITWGMQEDAEEEEEEENLDEITWRTYKGQLTEKQQKTLEKVQKRNEKLANLKKEIDAIQAKEIAQGGLTQGQQTQIARNEQRIEQLMEELDSLEETLDDSIRESLGARSRKGESVKKPGFFDEDEDNNSSDDEFYNRATKTKDKKKDTAMGQQVETAESLLDKRSSILEGIEKVKADLEAEERRQLEETSMTSESVDPLDAFMTGVSKDMKKDRTGRLTKRLEALCVEEERLSRLLRIADPTEEALKKWEAAKAKLLQVEQSVSNASIVASKAIRISGGQLVGATPIPGAKKNVVRVQPVEERKQGAVEQGKPAEPQLEVEAKLKDPNEIAKGEIKALEAPLRLGAQPDVKIETPDMANEDADNAGEFLEYKDRLKGTSAANGKENMLPPEPSGLILQRPPDESASNHEPTGINDEAQDAAAADAVALLLRHKDGLASAVAAEEKGGKRGKKRKKRKLSTVPLADEGGTGYENWVPPKGQTGDGKTFLNEKYGY